MQSTEFELEKFIPYLLNQAAETSSLAFEKVYKGRYGMLRTEWRVLFHLGLYGRMTASEIGTRAKMHKTKISRAVHRLTERRMVTRARDTDDRRMEHLTLTAKGRAAYEDLSGIAARYEVSLLNGLSRDEVAVLRTALVKLAESKPISFT
ncbi:MarR family winged helix-turn-helix transcriptional regulator [Sulfitobacter aestuariivivens]|uniref:MarR family transcriptional regulator n=1 Tax=Sulfitobacter aestuariivivens TaxID=2766981 RepID=A0A927HFQ1_9RHOB|nr:MarR family transcriptional regulator [Sulfitobacter aestuariivivens]MBD3664673.1 MarR family transcriptional regulator [Sulfitobacter aestuariivivens]